MKYRLKQWYPSLPNIWTEGDIVKEYSGKYYNKETIDGSNGIPKSEVENNPDYWKPVEEKRYEILSFWNGAHKSRITKIEDFEESLQEILNNNYWEIYSVKRLSDGKVFTIADRIKLSTGSVIKIGHIDFPSREDTKKKIYLHNKKRTKDEPYTKNSEINNVELINEPLFTTEDEVDIYEGDKYFEIRGNSTYYSSFIAGQEPKAMAHSEIKLSTEEKAKEYIDKHKKQFSKHDIGKAITKTLNFNRDHIIDEFLDNLYE